MFQIHQQAQHLDDCNACIGKVFLILLRAGDSQISFGFKLVNQRKYKYVRAVRTTYDTIAMGKGVGDRMD